jgi:uncharacterized membrane protein YfcA
MILPGLSAELGWPELATVFGALAMGGVLKGVTGAGAPIVAVPVMAALVDLRLAVMVMLVPNLLTNIRQAHQFRDARPERAFLLPYLGAGVVGVLAGTALLNGLDGRMLEVMVGATALAYVAFRLAQPGWRLDMPGARRLALPAGAASGLLQGATGLSAPATLGFLNAMQLPRRTFVATVALLFCLFSAVHMVALGALGLFTPGIAMLSALALIPILLGMELGGRLAARIDARLFDRLILGLLTVVAAKAILG